MKRKFFSFLIFAFYFVHSLAQSNLIAYDYWFDADFAAKITTPISPVSSFQLTTGIPMGTLKPGLHSFHIRFNDDSLRYTTTQSHYFFYSIPLLVEYEYWVDNNFAARTVQSISPSQIANVQANVNVNSISVGVHVFNIRFKSANGLYSELHSSYFFNSASTISGYEYWVDNNFAARTVQSISPSQVANVQANVNVNSISVGVHVFNIRFKSANGLYSELHSSYFFNSASTISGYEYWFDSNYNSKVSQTNSPSQYLNLNQGIDVSTLIAGYHTFNIRYLNSDQSWSTTQSSFFVKLGDAPNGNVISAYRYWFDEGDSTLVNLAVASPAKTVHLTAALTVPALIGAVHKVNIQFRDTSQLWSGVISHNFVLCANGNPASSAGAITGLTQVSACTNQNGIVYSIDTIANATNYNWMLPPLASIVGNADTNTIVVNYSPYSTSGNVTVGGSNSCGSGSSSSLAINFKPVPLAQICKATIDSATQKTFIEWQKPLETYVSGFVIYRDIAGVFTNIDTVSNSAFSSYLDTGSHPEMQSEKYKIAVLDSCGNTGDISAPFTHQTINLYGSIQLGGIAKLYWNDYVGINDSLRTYTLLRDTIGGAAFTDTIAKNIIPNTFMNATDITSASYPLCRYVVELVYESNCTPGLRTLLNKSTSRSNIRNKAALIDSGSVGINAVEIAKMDIKIYPNPVKENFTISNLDANLAYDLKLYNSIGQCIFQTTTGYGKNKAEIQTAHFLKGLYLLKITAKQARTIFKIQIE